MGGVGGVGWWGGGVEGGWGMWGGSAGRGYTQPPGQLVVCGQQLISRWGGKVLWGAVAGVAGNLGQGGVRCGGGGGV